MYAFDRCMFCLDNDMTEEHFIADWVLRAFMKKRRPDPGFNGTFESETELRMRAGEAVQAAKVVCRRCNNEWMSAIDRAAAAAFKPLIQSRTATEFELNPEGQRAVAASLFKSALVYDAYENGRAGQLAPLRAAFARERVPPVASFICVGPTSRVPLSVPGSWSLLS